MHPKVKSHVITIVALAIALSLAPLSEARAQHSGHQGHEWHHGHGAKKQPAKKKAPAKKRGSAATGAHHAAHGVTASPAVREYQVAHHKMMRDMALPYTGDPDVDFRVQMIPHHQGAIDMARVALRHAKDPGRGKWPRASSSSNSARSPRCRCGSRSAASDRLLADNRPTSSGRTRIGRSRKSPEPEPSCAGSPGHRDWASRLRGEAPSMPLRGGAADLRQHRRRPRGRNRSGQAAHGRNGADRAHGEAHQ
jgi:Domain of unknown function (DUF305)